MCEAAGVDEANYEVSEIVLPGSKLLTQMRRLLLIAKVFNGGWVPDLGDTNQTKYYPWFRINKERGASGFSLSYYGYVYADARTRLGVRPYFKDSDTAVYVGKLFLAEYERLAEYENMMYQVD